YHHRNGGGDKIRTDGDLPIVELRHLTAPSTRIRAQIEADDGAASFRRLVPLTVAFAVALVVVRSVVGLSDLARAVPLQRLTQLPVVMDWIDGGMSADAVITTARLVLLLYFLLYGVLGVLVYRGRRWARTAALLLSTAGVLAWAVQWLIGIGRSATAVSLL